jgi:hypothetical protein
LKRKFNPADFGFTEEQWQALSDERKLHFRARAYHMRNGDRRREYQREYHHKVAKGKRRTNKDSLPLDG